MRSSSSDRVARHFDAHARDFDAIYSADKGLARSLRDRVTRGTVVRRLDFVNDLAEDDPPRRVLDVGCGSGRFGASLAQRGAEVVVGLDFAPEMLVLAEQRCAEAGVADRCTFLEADFLTWEWDEPFDLVLAVGVLDYVAEADPFIARLASASRGTTVISFPRLVHPLVPVRAARLRMNGCPVFFYRRNEVESFGRRHFPSSRVIPFDRDFLLLGQAT
ncbi:MAG: class I SAM-dependent methyltransferase [Actinomycetota bacterium]|nr:class I SAM-dependent methyltransferase [Actinomycetota bacterium]